MTSSSFSISLCCSATSCRRQRSTAAAQESRRRFVSLSPSLLFDDCCRSRRCVVRSRCAALSSQATAASRTFCALAWRALAVRPGIGPCASGMTVSPGPGMALCRIGICRECVKTLAAARLGAVAGGQGQQQEVGQQQSWVSRACRGLVNQDSQAHSERSSHGECRGSAIRSLPRLFRSIQRDRSFPARTCLHLASAGRNDAVA